MEADTHLDTGWRTRYANGTGWRTGWQSTHADCAASWTSPVRVNISVRTRQRFADFCSDNSVVREIQEVFEAEGFIEKAGHVSSYTGARRSLVDAFHASIDFNDPAQQYRLLRVYVEAIESWGRRGEDRALAADARALITRLRNDGAPIDDEARITSAAPVAAAIPLERFPRIGDPGALAQHLERISGSITSDPAAAIGASKELVESVCKHVLDDYGATYGRKDDLPGLYRKVAEALSLTRESVPDSSKGSQAAQKALQNLATTVQSLAELRNELGWGHGRTSVSPALARHARLAYNAARAVAEFLLDTWHARREADETGLR